MTDGMVRRPRGALSGEHVCAFLGVASQVVLRRVAVCGRRSIPPVHAR